MDDCVIIGGGVIGLSLAYELAGRGRNVRLVERGQPGEQASWAGAGILPPATFRPGDKPHERLAGLSHELHPRWAAQLREMTGIDNGFRRCGGIQLALGAEAVDRLTRFIASWKARDIRVEALRGEQLAQVEPALADQAALAADGMNAACLLPDECQLRNPRHLRALAAACHLRGVEFTTGVLAEDFEVRGGRVQAVRTSAGPIAAGQFCVAAGCWTGPLARRLGLEAAIKPIRGQMVLLNCSRPPLGHIINEGPRYVVPRNDGRVLVGSTQEDVGFDCRTTAAGVSGLLDFALGLVPILKEARIERTWAGLRPKPEGRRPYLGRLPEVENAFIAAGHFRSGLHLAPATAQVMAQLMCGQTPDVDLTAFRPDRR